MKMIASILSWAAPGVGGVINPMVLLAIALAAAAIAAAGFGAGWSVNGWRLGNELATVRSDLRDMTTQAAVCADKLATQNQAVDVLGQLGGQIQQGTAAVLADLRKAAAGQIAGLDRLRGRLEGPAPVRPDGRPAGCDDAWREIEQGRGKP